MFWLLGTLKLRVFGWLLTKFGSLSCLAFLGVRSSCSRVSVTFILGFRTWVALVNFSRCRLVLRFVRDISRLGRILFVVRIILRIARFCL